MLDPDDELERQIDSLGWDDPDEPPETVDPFARETAGSAPRGEPSGS